MQSVDVGLGGTIHNESSTSHSAELVESDMNSGDLEDINKLVRSMIIFFFRFYWISISY